MTKISLTSKPSRSPDITFQSMPPETILLNLESGYYYSANALGSAIWQRCDGETTTEQLIRTLHPQYEVSIEQLRRDVVEYIERLADEGLLLVDSDA